MSYEPNKLPTLPTHKQHYKGFLNKEAYVRAGLVCETWMLHDGKLFLHDLAKQLNVSQAFVTNVLQKYYGKTGRIGLNYQRMAADEPIFFNGRKTFCFYCVPEPVRFHALKKTA